MGLEDVHALVSSVRRLAGLLGACLVLGACVNHEAAPHVAAQTQPAVGEAPALAALPSWQEGAARAAIVKFVADVTHEGASTYVAPEARIAVFDNDGTLWSEYPVPFQLAFMVDQVRQAGHRHPEWARNPAYQALLAHDTAALAADRKALVQLLARANSGMTTDEYDRSIRTWLANATHPTLHRPYTELVYQPQIELLDFLRTNGFKIWSVSGGTAEFMRIWVGKAYGVPPEQVAGTQEKLQYAVRDGKPVLIREPGFDFVDDRDGNRSAFFVLSVGVRFSLSATPMEIERCSNIRPAVRVGHSAFSYGTMTARVNSPTTASPHCLASIRRGTTPPRTAGSS